MNTAEKYVFIKKCILISLLAVCMTAFFSFSAFAQQNTFTFSENKIEASDGSAGGYKIEGTSLTINEAGTYVITGSCPQGSIKVKKETTDVTLVLKDLTLSCSDSAPIVCNKSTGTVIQVEDTVTLADKENINEEETNADFEGACIKVKSGASLVISGDGTLNIDGSVCKNGIKGAATSKITVDGSVVFNIKAANSGLAADGSMILNGGTFNVEAEDAIKCDPDDDDTESLGDLTVNGGNYKIKASGDGIRANGKLEINDGVFDITAEEGLEATYLLINGGTFTINASDDGINASDKSSRYAIKIEINGGNITLKMAQGDTDAFDSNGDLIINGGTLNITAQFPFDFDGKGEFNGGDITVNGQKVTSLTGQMMGGFGRMNGQMPPEMSGMNVRDGRMMPGSQNAEQFSDGQTPPEMPEGEMPPEMPGMNVRGGREMFGMDGKGKWSKASDWAKEELNKAYGKKLIPEILDNNDLTECVTRKEFAHIIVRMYEALSGKQAQTSGENPFADTDDGEVLKAYCLGITKGTSENTFSPNDLITREEIAAMTTRAMDAAGVNTEFDASSVNVFDDDCDMHDWGRKAVYFMSCHNIIKGMGDNKFDANGNATREQALLICERSVEQFAKA